ncbi:hypothetical protein [Candidatus Chloroploca sp. Khr17]|uniref:hypothetical protein n=1 Tax=Candidatus Chloroploca sp. Khr17 TaxID=2496869 RepID=UPI00101C9F17|nr:hypothetical protein [Candidatus Chloroploca sp. Khr17]
MNDDIEDATILALAARLRALAHEWGEAAARSAWAQQGATLAPNDREQLALLVFGDGNGLGALTTGHLAGRDQTTGTVEVSGTVAGPVIGVNLGTISFSQPGPMASPPSLGPPPAPVAPDQVAQQQDRLAAYRRTLAHYLQQLALLGSAHARPEISHGLHEAREGIARAKAVLRGWGIMVADHPDDG